MNQSFFDSGYLREQRTRATQRKVWAGFLMVSLMLSIGGVGSMFLNSELVYAAEEPVTSSATINTTKVVCDSEADLPNWSTTAHVIDVNTATDYVAASDGKCHIAQDWNFQWAGVAASDPGDAFVGEASAEDGWSVPFIGETVINFTEALSVWVREVLKDGYIPFTFHTDNSDVSAEMYCNGDVYNYDNLDEVVLVDGNTTYCVAFNAPKVVEEETPTDVCPNIDEAQATVPEGKELVEGQCVDVVVPVTDVCPNIEGAQETTPSGKQIVEGQCVDVPAAPAPTPTTSGGGGGAVGLAFLGGSQPTGVSFGSAPAGLVLGASTSTEDLPANCTPYLNTYLRMGGKNNTEDVAKLQTFLNEQLGLTLPVTGHFGPATFKAVKQFQLENDDQVLAPWVPHGLHEKTPTGYVYKTTKRWINLLQCKTLDIPMPQLP